MNIPNLLSLFRLMLVPVFAVVFFLPDDGARHWAAGIYVLAFVTDVADGYIARRFNQITKLGRVLDPLADKLMTFTVIISITAARIIPIWAVLVFAAKEAAMAVGGLSMLHKTGDVIAANWLGKLSTFVFFVVCAALVLFPAIPRAWATVMISAALALAIAALLVYIWKYLKTMGNAKDS